MGKPQDWNSRIGRDIDAKPVYKISAAVDDESGADVKVTETLSSDGRDGKIDCNCHKPKPKITYGPEQIIKGKPETYIHHQPKIIVRQPPTHVRIEHPPTIIQPSTIVFRRHGKTIRRPVVYQHLPQDVEERPVYVNVVRPIEKKVIIENKAKQADIINSNAANLEYETLHGGRTYSESFDEQQQESLDIQRSKHVKATNEFDPIYNDGHTYSGSYEEQQQESIGMQKSNRVQAKIEATEYDPIYGGGQTYSGSYEEQQQEAVDLKKSQHIQAEEYDTQYGGHHYSEVFDEQEHSAESYQANVNVKESVEYWTHKEIN